MSKIYVILRANFIFLYLASNISAVSYNKSTSEICPVYKKGPNLNVLDLVGSWLTVFVQPVAIECFKFRVRATTELEREQYEIKYGNFKDRVKWSSCFLQVETSSLKHFLQGNGSESGLMQNVIIYENEPGEYMLRNVSADQWMVFGRRGSEVLVIRDCYGETAAAFARSPYWPTMTELSAIFHRCGITTQTYKRSICLPAEVPAKEYFFDNTNSNRTTNVTKCIDTDVCEKPSLV